MPWPPTTHQDVQDEVSGLRTSVPNKSDKASVEGIAVWSGSAWPTRPTGFARIRWVGGTTQPAGMVAGDIWERQV